MTRRTRLALLVSLNAFAFGMMLLVYLTELADSNLFIRILALPMLWTMPWSPPLLLALLFETLAHDKRGRMRAARIIGAILIYLAFFLQLLGFAFSSEIYFDPLELAISASLLLLGAGLSWIGLRGAKAAAEPA